MKVRPIAIYLPQFHPIPENNIWWGEGFTEWTNVTKAKPLFKNHYQPHLPTDLGFYDLRLEDARIAQEKLARENGIYGFCYYHYWFNGKLVLEKPLEKKIANPNEDLPFMICWANENWTKTWDGEENHVLLEQNYSDEDNAAHIEYLLQFLKDTRYIKIDGRPVLAIYRTTSIPNLNQLVKVWRTEALKVGIDLYLCRFESFGESGHIDGFDATIEFQPFTKYLHDYKSQQKIVFWDEPITKIYLKLLRIFGFRNAYNRKIWSRINRLDYQKYINWLLENYSYPLTYKRFPCVFPSWDNTARRGENSFLFYNAEPDDFRKFLTFHFEKFKPFSSSENLLFINAWNEWAEGNHIEPCRKHARGYLNVIRELLTSDFEK